jgi:hypothetical protein
MGNGRRWSRDLIPVWAGENLSRTDPAQSKQAVNESSGPRTPATGAVGRAGCGGPARPNHQRRKKGNDDVRLTIHQA